MKAIITGSFDPITVGHIEIIKKARTFFDELYVVALLNADKKYMFSLEEKKEIMRSSLKEFDNVVVDAYNGLTADYMHLHGINKIVRGIRNDEDRKYEQKLAETMKNFDKEFDTIFIDCDRQYENISSTYVREKIQNGEDISGLVSPKAQKLIIKIFNSKK